MKFNVALNYGGYPLIESLILGVLQEKLRRFGARENMSGEISQLAADTPLLPSTCNRFPCTVHNDTSYS